VQYFQFRKGRGASEKFHGAVVDHQGTENTRVFKDVANVGERLKGMDAILGSDTPSAVAIIYDWNIRWALDDMQGLLQQKTGYIETALNHYRAFWQMGIPVDLINSQQNLADYDLVVAPMLYLLRPGTAEALEEYVKQGGTLVLTYASGYVNDTDLTFLGGFPGGKDSPLRKTMGIWCEEIDALYPEDRNSIEWQGKSYEAFDLCELIHTEGAKAQGTYGKDFYAGQPALTVNSYGKGKAWFIAARTGQDFLGDFYNSITAECDIKRVLERPLPPGVTAQVRSDGKTEHVFVMNFNPQAVQVDAGILGQKKLEPWEVWIIKRDHQG
jgi:beta-galactosidase